MEFACGSGKLFLSNNELTKQIINLKVQIPYGVFKYRFLHEGNDRNNSN